MQDEGGDVEVENGEGVVQGVVLGEGGEVEDDRRDDGGERGGELLQEGGWRGQCQEGLADDDERDACDSEILLCSALSVYVSSSLIFGSMEGTGHDIRR